MRRRPRSLGSNYAPGADYAPPPNNRGNSGKSSSSGLNSSTIAILAAVFVLGIGVGTTFSSVSSNGGNGSVATRLDIEQAVPNPELCAQFGAAAMVTEMKIYQTLNPFTVYVSQPKSVPGCVLRSTNWSLLEQRQLVNSEQVRECRNRMNTFAFTGTIDDKPEIKCVYQANENLFLNRLGGGGAAPDTEKF